MAIRAPDGANQSENKVVLNLILGLETYPVHGQENNRFLENKQANSPVLNSGHHLFFMTLWVVWKLEKKWSNHRQTCLRRFPGENIDYNQYICCHVR